jgi:hypothetical protein
MGSSERGLPLRRRRGRGAALLRAIALAAAAAAADPGAPAAAAEPTAEEIAAARQLFVEAKDLEKKEEWEPALERLRKVAEVKMTPQVRFHVALCEEHLGRLVSALNGFELAAEEARRAGRSAREVAENAPRRAEALRKRVAAVRVDVSGTVRTSRVLIDGKPVAPALFGTQIPLDPGAHTVSVDSGGKTTFSKDVTLAERGRETVEIAIDDPETPPEPPPPKPTASASAAPPKPPPKPPPLVARERIPAVIAGGVGVAALAGAGVFFGLRESKFSAVRETCKGDPQVKKCDSDTEPLFEQGKTYTTVAAVLGGVGVAGLATAGVLWFVLAPAPGAEQKSSIRIAPTPGGVRVLGAF